MVVSGLDMVEDLRKASPDVLSFRGASADVSPSPRNIFIGARA